MTPTAPALRAATGMPVLPARLDKASHEIALMMEMNGFQDWCHGPLAERKYLERVVRERDATLSALEGLGVFDGQSFCFCQDVKGNLHSPKCIAARAVLAAARKEAK